MNLFICHLTIIPNQNERYAYVQPENICVSRCFTLELTSFSFHFIYFAFINYSTKLKLIIIHLAGSPGSYFAYLKDCLKKRSKKLECKLSVAEHKY